MVNSSKEKITQYFNPKIIDYANSEIQCDTLDVFLASECEYFISNSSGIDTLATLLKKPILFLNFPNFSYIATWQPNTMYSFKDYLKRENFEKINLQYIFKNNLYDFLKSEDFEFNNIILQENSSEENLNYMIEFDDALKSGKLSEFEILPELERKFWEIFPFSKILHPGSVHRCRISQLYLRKMDQIN
jgi:putative glycosyltransferase (TIGR04372 family)